MMCATCRYWHHDTDDANGECRAHPPTVTQASCFPKTTWPKVGYEDWCGEYAASAIEARSDATGTGAAEGESAVGNAETPNNHRDSSHD